MTYYVIKDLKDDTYMSLSDRGVAWYKARRGALRFFSKRDAFDQVERRKNWDVDLRVFRVTRKPKPAAEKRYVVVASCAPVRVYLGADGTWSRSLECAQRYLSTRRAGPVAQAASRPVFDYEIHVEAVTDV